MFYTDTLPKRESVNPPLVPARRVLLVEAIRIARELETALVDDAGPRGHVALGGGTLHRGHSDKDVDLIVYPRGHRPGLTDALGPVCTSLGWKAVASAAEMRARWERDAEGYAPIDDKHVEVWVTPEGIRVDLIVLGVRDEVLF